MRGASSPSTVTACSAASARVNINSEAPLPRLRQPNQHPPRGLPARGGGAGGDRHRAATEPLGEGWRPVVVVRAGPKPGLIGRRLVAGPVANAGFAARLGAVPAATGLTCQPAVFDGQRLALK